MGLLAKTGRTDVLADLATYEIFHEVGDPSGFRSALEITATSPDLSAADRFTVLDALTFWDLQGLMVEANQCAADPALWERLSEMQALADSISPNNRERIVVCLRRMVLAGLVGDTAELNVALEDGMATADGDASVERIIRYTHAGELYRIGDNGGAQQAALALVEEYFFYLGLDFGDVFAANPAEILALLGDDADHADNFKHLADCLYLVAMTSPESGPAATLARMHAMKFYTLGSAWRSAVRAGQEVVDDLVAIGDISGARSVVDDYLIRIITEYPLSDLVVGVRSQRAVVLAWYGEFEEARAEMARLASYDVPPRQREELANQRALIERIAGLSNIE